MKGTVMYDAPRVMYLRGEWGGVCECHVVGETSQSWLTGDRDWNRNRYSKREHAVVTEVEYRDYKWAEANRWKISGKIDSRLDVTPAQLRQIAAIIGYTEEK